MPLPTNTLFHKFNKQKKLQAEIIQTYLAPILAQMMGTTISASCLKMRT